MELRINLPSHEVGEVATVASGHVAKHSELYIRYEFWHSVQTEALLQCLQSAEQSLRRVRSNMKKGVPSHVDVEMANVVSGQEAKHSD